MSPWLMPAVVVVWGGCIAAGYVLGKRQGRPAAGPAGGRAGRRPSRPASGRFRGLAKRTDLDPR